MNADRTTSDGGAMATGGRAQEGGTRGRNRGLRSARAGYPGAVIADPTDIVAREMLPTHVASVGRARRFVRHTLAEMAPSLDPERVDDIVLAASELVTNSVTHGSGDHVTVVLRRRRGEVTLEVASGVPPAAGLPDVASWTNSVPVEALGGRGLMLVKSVADRVATRILDGVATVACTFTAEQDR